MRRSVTAAVVAVVLQVVGAGAAHALQPKLSLAEIAQSSDLVFVGTVAGQTSRINDAQTLIYTDVVFENVTVIHARDQSVQRSQTSITLTYAGGSVGDIAVRVGHSPVFVVGRRYLVFASDDGQTYLNPVVGGDQGVFEIADDPVLQQEFVFTADRRAVLGVRDGELTASVQPDRPMSLDGFVDHIRNVALTTPVPSPVLRRGSSGLLYRKVNGRIRGEALRGSDAPVRTLRDRLPLASPDQATPSLAILADTPSEPRAEPEGGTLSTCGSRVPPLTMEQVPSTWWEWSANDDSMAIWNQAMDLYRSIPNDGSSAWMNVPQHRSEFVGYPTNADLNRIYGFNWGSALAVTILWGTGASCGNRIWEESDLAWNPAYSWTDDFEYSLGRSSVILQQPTTMHELGHTWGYQLNGETYDYDVASVMQPYYSYVVEDGRGIHAADATFFRQVYKGTLPLPSTKDVGVESYYASNGLRNTTTDSWSFGLGGSISIQNLLIENIGSADATNVELRLYLSTDRTITTDDYQLGGPAATWVWPSLCTGCSVVPTFNTTIPSTVPSGMYYVGAIVTIDGGTDDDAPYNNATSLYDPIWVSGSVLPVTVTVTTDPPGLEISVDSVTYTAPKTFQWTPGTPHSISAATPQGGSPGTRYAWSRWSNDGPRSQTVAPTSSTSYIAYFGPQYSLTMTAGPGGTVSPVTGWYDAGTAVTIQASASAGFVFSNWAGTGDGSYSGTNNPATISMSGPVVQSASFVPSQVPPSGFFKTAPADRAGNQSLTMTLKWTVSSLATSYEYCVSTEQTCSEPGANGSPVGTWTSVGSALSAVVAGLATNTPYYWQVRSRNVAGTTAADSSAWWSFTTQLPPSVSVSTFTPTIAEDGSVTGTFSVKRSRPLSHALPVSILLGGVAVKDIDYTAEGVSGCQDDVTRPGMTRCTVAIPGGGTSQTSKVVVRAIGNDIAEGDKAITLTSLPGDTYLVARLSSATITIVDDDICAGDSPDLVVSSLVVPSANTGGGQVLPVTLDTLNQGTLATNRSCRDGTGDSTTRLYLSTDSAFSADDIPLGSTSVGVLGAGDASASLASVVVPADTPGGTHYLLARADADLGVAESNESNNVTAVQLKVGPDVVVSTFVLGSSQVRPGGVVTATVTTKNNGGGGSGPSVTGIYLSDDFTFDAAVDVRLVKVDVPPLGPGATYTTVVNGTIPASGAAGVMYYLIAVADADSQLSETNEKNNKKLTFINVQ